MQILVYKNKILILYWNNAFHFHLSILINFFIHGRNNVFFPISIDFELYYLQHFFLNQDRMEIVDSYKFLILFRNSLKKSVDQNIFYISIEKKNFFGKSIQGFWLR